MKKKRIDIEVPIHIKKFIEKEYCQHLMPDGTLKCDKRTYLGCDLLSITDFLIFSTTEGAVNIRKSVFYS